jgi:hypothetical protein
VECVHEWVDAQNEIVKGDIFVCIKCKRFHLGPLSTAPQAEYAAPAGVLLTDAEIVAIRDEHLPSQGEPFDCIAFALDIIAAERERCARICEARIEEVGLSGFPHYRSRSASECAAAIRAQKGSDDA